MKYVAIDIETTGLDPNTCQVLQIGAVIEDTTENVPVEELPSFVAYIAPTEIRGTVYALHMNRDILRIIAEAGDRVMLPGQAVYEFQQWLQRHGYEEDIEGVTKFTAAGKNVGSFDEQFLIQLPMWKDILDIRHRKLDPAMLYIDWGTDEVPPNLETCLMRAGILEEVTHDALNDAKQIIKLLRARRNFR